MHYCDKDGQESDEFPINPNGSIEHIAGVSNVQGNVIAMMPHPERINGGQVFFKSLHTFFETPPRPTVIKTSDRLPELPTATVGARDQYDLLFLVQLKITDTAAASMQMACQHILGETTHLRRFITWGINTGGQDARQIADQICQSGELWNDNKEQAFCQINGEWYKEEVKRLVPAVDFDPRQTYLTQENEDIVGQAMSESLVRHHNIKSEIHHGIAWSFENAIDERKLIESNLLTNPVSWKVSLL